MTDETMETLLIGVLEKQDELNGGVLLALQSMALAGDKYDAQIAELDARVAVLDSRLALLVDLMRAVGATVPASELHSRNAEL